MTITIITATTTTPIINTDATTATFQQEIIISIQIIIIITLLKLRHPTNSLTTWLHRNTMPTHTPHLRLLFSHLLCHLYHSHHIICKLTKPLPYLVCHFSLTKYLTIRKDFNTYLYTRPNPKKGIVHHTHILLYTLHAPPYTLYNITFN